MLVIGPADDDKADALAASEIDRAEAEGVRFLGLRHDMRELYALMDLFVLASHREGFPRAAMEAAAMGIPVVATQIRGCREVVENGVNGFLVPVRNADVLAMAIARLLDDEQLRKSMSKAGRKKAVERFDVRNVARIVLDTYRQVAAEKCIPLLVAPGLPHAALSSDASALALLHTGAISTGFLSTLGSSFLVQIYRGLISDPASVVLVVRDEESEVVGFIAGSIDTGTFYRRMIRRRAFPIGLAALPALVADPRKMGRVVETIRYPGSYSPELPRAELLAMAVSEKHRSRGVGSDLVKEFLARLGVPAVRVVVGADNQGAGRFYRAQGFIPTEGVEVHRGQRSEVLVWRSS